MSFLFFARRHGAGRNHNVSRSEVAWGHLGVGIGRLLTSIASQDDEARRNTAVSA